MVCLVELKEEEKGETNERKNYGGRDLKKERGSETGRGIETSIDRGRERVSWLSTSQVHIRFSTAKE